MFVTIALLAAMEAPEMDLSLPRIVERLSRIERKAYPTTDDLHAFDDLLRRVKKLYPDEPVTSYWQGIAAERQGDPANAERHWREVLELLDVGKNRDPSLMSDCYVRLGYLCLATDRAEEANRLGRRAATLSPSRVPPLALVADASLANGQVVSAIAFLESAQSREESPPAARWLTWELLAMVGEWERLRIALDRFEVNAFSAEIEHFRALLAGSEADRLGELLHHFLAAEIGGGFGKLTMRSERRLDRMLSQEEESTASLRPWLAAIRTTRDLNDLVTCDQLLRSLESAQPVQELVAWHLRARCLVEAGRSREALTLWQRTNERWPTFVPALLATGELIEVLDDANEASPWFEKAKALAPDARGVREHFRLGLTLAIDEAGVRVVAMDAASPMQEIGVQPGDILLRLDGAPLDDLPPRTRLRRVRRFSGGEVQFRATTGEEITLDLPLQFDEAFSR